MLFMSGVSGPVNFVRWELPDGSSLYASCWAGEAAAVESFWLRGAGHVPACIPIWKLNVRLPFLFGR